MAKSNLSLEFDADVATSRRLKNVKTQKRRSFVASILSQAAEKKTKPTRVSEFPGHTSEDFLLVRAAGLHRQDVEQLRELDDPTSARTILFFLLLSVSSIN